MQQQAVLNCLMKDQKNLKHYGVKTLSLFGSVARGEEKESSDVDILVSFKNSLGLFAFMALKDHLEEVLGMEVDLVTEKALHPHLRNKILQELIHVI